MDRYGRKIRSTLVRGVEVCNDYVTSDQEVRLHWSCNMSEKNIGTRSIHRALAQELTPEEIQQVAGGDTTYTTYDEPGAQIGHTDHDVGGTWKWSF